MFYRPIKILVFLSFFSLFLFLPSLLLASDQFIPGFYVNAAKQSSVANPLIKEGETRYIPPGEITGKIVSVILGLVGIFALFAFIIGGMYFLTSQGNPEKIKKGTSVIVWAVIGLVVSFGSYVFLQYIVENIGKGRN